MKHVNVTYTPPVTETRVVEITPESVTITLDSDRAEWLKSLLNYTNSRPCLGRHLTIVEDHLESPLNCSTELWRGLDVALHAKGN